MGAFIGLLPEVIKAVPGIISVVEKLFPGKGRGPEKRSAAVGFIKIAVGLAEGVAGKDYVQDELFSEGIGEIVDGAVKVMNSINKQEQSGAQKEEG